MNVISRAVLTAVATAGVALPATAQQGALSGFPSFDSVDANLDGTIAREEFRRALSEVEQPDQLFAEARTHAQELHVAIMSRAARQTGGHPRQTYGLGRLRSGRRRQPDRPRGRSGAARS